MDTGTKRLVKGFAYGLLGAVVFILLVLLMYLVFTLIEPLIGDLVERLTGSNVAERIREFIRTAR